jgi:hypothetical protein
MGREHMVHRTPQARTARAIAVHACGARWLLRLEFNLGLSHSGQQTVYSCSGGACIHPWHMHSMSLRVDWIV